MVRKVRSTISSPQPVVSVLPDLYEVGEWAGRPHYRCKLCPFNTLIGQDTVLTHLVDRHSSDAALEILFPKATTNETPTSEVASEEIDHATNGPN